MRRAFLALALLLPAVASAQDFDSGAYRSFLERTADLSSADLLRLHDAGTFAAASPETDVPLYLDSLDLHYGLTADEAGLLGRHGFVVTERVAPHSFGNGLLDVYIHDLPVFLSTDAVLHALHMSYDSILMQTESSVLAPLLERVLSDMHDEVPNLQAAYAGADGMTQPVRDLDVYLTIARTLLAEGAAAPRLPDNRATVDELLALIEAESPVSYPLFAQTCRQLDFSQFTVRGHYSQVPELGRYFQAMMWLGRTEIYLSAPSTDVCAPSEADVQRQTVLAHLLAEAAEASGARPQLDAMDALLARFVGEPDNVTLDGLATLDAAAGVVQADDLLDPALWDAYADAIADAPWTEQRIRSQILVNGTPTDPNVTRPAAAFLLMGQRFVIDSYVTSSVVYDAIAYRGRAVKRMLPSSLDVLFALGNDAAGQLLADELERYPYGSNLAAVRYLVDSYSDDFWDRSLYNGWLGAIRTLNPPADRAALPAFMQTAAWWQQKANTQLAAWAQLRHDNLLYAKQSYTAVPGCSYPYSYVEPIPAFYTSVAQFARTASSGFEPFANVEGMDVERMQSYFGRLAAINDTLASVAQKELDGVQPSVDEAEFLSRMISRVVDGCVPSITGWYKDLYYGGAASAREPDLVVADVHTAPADANGAPVGWVMHAGTGPLNLAVVTADVPGVGPVAFAGPVMSYVEHLSTGFERLTDEDWGTAHAEAPSFRPDFVNLYLADASGAAYPAGRTLERVGVSSEVPPGLDTPDLRLTPNVPNPFADRTAIGVTVTRALGSDPVELAIYDVRGRLVRSLLSQRLSVGHYTIAWDGTDASGQPAASGTYLVRARAGAQEATRAITLVR